MNSQHIPGIEHHTSKTLRLMLILGLTLACALASAQSPATEKLKSDTLLIITKQPQKGFSNDYILFIPKGTPLNKKVFLLVEPNNTGKLSDSMNVHTEHAIHLASKSSVGNN